MQWIDFKLRCNALHRYTYNRLLYSVYTLAQIKLRHIDTSSLCWQQLYRPLPFGLPCLSQARTTHDALHAQAWVMIFLPECEALKAQVTSQHELASGGTGSMVQRHERCECWISASRWHTPGRWLRLWRRRMPWGRSWGRKAASSSICSVACTATPTHLFVVYLSRASLALNQNTKFSTM